jgi:Icc-related predicted phosphoesterase
MRLFFATDLHGSEVCFRKFCEAADFYRCDVLIMGGDVTGKLLVPIVRDGDQVRYDIGGATREVAVERLDAEKKRIANMGYYPVDVDAEEATRLDDRDAYDERLLEEALERARAWARYADDRLGGSDVSIYFAPGNDDDFAVDAAFSESSVFVNCEQKVVELGDVEMASTGWANRTPWKTPRECDEDELGERLETLVSELRDPEQAIFNFHVPPHGTPLDVCPEIDEEFRVVKVMGNPVQAHAGSTAVRSVIERHQPVASLHGHIHESRNATKLGRTLAINPGSEYGEGVLLGAIVTLKRGKANYTFTAG